MAQKLLFWEVYVVLYVSPVAIMIGVQFASIKVLVCLGLCTTSRGSTVSLFVSAVQEGELFRCLSLQQLNCFALRLLVNSLTQAVAPKKWQQSVMSTMLQLETIFLHFLIGFDHDRV